MSRINITKCILATALCSGLIGCGGDSGGESSVSLPVETANSPSPSSETSPNESQNTHKVFGDWVAFRLEDGKGMVLANRDVGPYNPALVGPRVQVLCEPYDHDIFVAIIPVDSSDDDAMSWVVSGTDLGAIQFRTTWTVERENERWMLLQDDLPTRGQVSVNIIDSVDEKLYGDAGSFVVDTMLDGEALLIMYSAGHVTQSDFYSLEGFPEAYALACLGLDL